MVPLYHPQGCVLLCWLVPNSGSNAPLSPEQANWDHDCGRQETDEKPLDKHEPGSHSSRALGDGEPTPSTDVSDSAVYGGGNRPRDYTSQAEPKAGEAGEDESFRREDAYEQCYGHE